MRGYSSKLKFTLIVNVSAVAFVVRFASAIQYRVTGCTRLMFAWKFAERLFIVVSLPPRYCFWEPLFQCL